MLSGMYDWEKEENFAFEATSLAASKEQRSSTSALFPRREVALWHHQMLRKTLDSICPNAVSLEGFQSGGLPLNLRPCYLGVLHGISPLCSEMQHSEGVYGFGPTSTIRTEFPSHFSTY